MKSSNRLILGSVMLIVGVSLLVFGFLLYIDTSGLNVLLYDANRHLFIFYYVLARILIIWGIALISAAVVLYLIVAIHKEFKSRKPMVMAVSVLLVGLSLSGFFVMTKARYILKPCPSCHVIPKVYGLRSSYLTRKWTITP